MTAYELAMERANNPYLSPEGNAEDFAKLAKMIAELEKRLGVKDRLLEAGTEALGLVKKYDVEKTGTWGTQSKPLTDDEIRELEQKYIEIELFDEGEYGTEYNVYGVKDLIKEVERIHGIK